MAITTTREQRRIENHERALAAYMEHHAAAVALISRIQIAVANHDNGPRSRVHQRGHRRLDGEDAPRPAGIERPALQRRRVRGMTPEIRAKVDASRIRMVVVLERLYTERDPGCRVWEHWSIPAFGGERMAVEGCRMHDILISSRDGNAR